MTRIREGTPVGARYCLDLLRGITTTSLEERRGWAGAAAWWFGDGQLDHREDVTLAWVLAWAAVLETRSPLVRGDLLDSLDVLSSSDRAPVGALDLVIATVPRAGLDVSGIESYDALLDARTRPGPTLPPEDRPNLPDVPPGEPIEPARCVELVRGLSATDPELRLATGRLLAAWTAEGRLDEDQGRTLAVVTTWTVQVETTDALGALLGALAALARRDLVPPWALQQVGAHLADGDLDATAAELRTELVAALAAHRARAAPP